MSPQDVTAASDALIAATQQAAVDSGQQVESAQGQLAPGLNTGSNAPGGYNYARNIAPIIDPLTTNLTVQARQAVLRQAIQDNLDAANNSYTDAQYAYRERQRAFQAEQARRQRERQRQADNAAALQLQQIKDQNAAQLATQSNGGVVVARPTSTLPVGNATPTRNNLSVVNSGGLQGWGGISNNAVLRVR